MNIADFTALLKRQLSTHLEHSGSILYSAVTTLKAGDVYLIGFNPGGKDDPAYKYLTISEQIDALSDRTTNAYLDEAWTGKVGEAPLQKRVTRLLEELGYQPREVCSSNLIFIRSQDYRGVEYTLADACWPVHAEIIDIVRPKLIIVFGNSIRSPYDYLSKKFNAGGKDERFPSGHGTWVIRAFNTVINDKPTCVIGLPHLSRYSPTGKPDVIAWIKRQLNN